MKNFVSVQQNFFLLKLSLLFNILFPTETYSQSLFNKRYGTSSYEQATAITLTADGGFAIVGNTDANGAGGDIFIIKLNAQGLIQWQKHIFGVNQDQAKAFYQLNNGDYIIGGYTFSYGSGNWDGFLIKLDSMGNMIWARAYGNSNSNVLYGLAPTNDGGFIGCGSATGQSAWLLKVDQNGFIQWSKSYANVEILYSVKETNDSGFIAVGYFNSGNILKTDGAGNPVWFRKSAQSYIFRDVTVLSDGSAIIAGTASDASLLKVDHAGNILWFKSYGFTFYEEGSSVKNTFDGGLIMAGYTNSFGHGDDDALLLKTDSTGNFEWAKLYGDAWEDRALQVLTLPDSGFIFAGYSYSSVNNDSSYAYVVRTDQDGVTSCNYIDWVPLTQTQNFNISSQIVTVTSIGVDSSCTALALNEFFIENDFCPPLAFQEIEEENNTTIFPNPGNGIFKFNNFSGALKNIIIYDTGGRSVYQSLVTEKSFTIDLSLLRKGIYFVKINSQDKITVDKIIIQ